MKTTIDAMILYLEEDGGEVLVSVEMIGQPKRAVILANAIVKDLMKIDWAFMAERSVFTDDPPTDYIQ